MKYVWGLGIGDWGLGIGDWVITICDDIKNETTQEISVGPS